MTKSKIVRFYPKIYRESEDSRLAARRHNPAFLIKVKNASGDTERFILKAGENDDLYFYRGDTGVVYCVNINRRLDYCGIDSNAMEGVFLQGSEQIDETLGSHALDQLSDRTIARRLIAFLHELQE